MQKLQSQWDFGDLLATPPARRILSVAELTTSIKRLLAQQIGRVWVTGEVTNLRLQSSGHLYFCLKDAAAQLNCVLFRGDARSFNRDLLRDGTRVNLNGELTVYEARGQYQLIVSTVELQGVGALQVAFEKLKQKLQAEGLFAQERKRPLPKYPWRVGVVTSKSGAAIRDVLHVVQRRHPGLELILVSCRVQGQGAGEEIACGIRLLNEWAKTAEVDPARGIDLILVTRGGGSLEDLWAFNEEVVARAIFESNIPVVSAVGHEIDFTISDFVADFRAATPSAAAEIITEGFFASRQFVGKAQEELRQLAWDRVRSDREELAYAVQRLQRQHPRRWLHEQWQRLDDLQNSLVRCSRHGYRLQQNAWRALTQRLLRVRPSLTVAQWRERLRRSAARYRELAQARWRGLQQRLSQAESRLRLLSPQNVLERGYSITMETSSQRVVQSADQVQPGQHLTSRLKHGQIDSVVVAHEKP